MIETPSIRARVTVVSALVVVVLVVGLEAFVYLSLRSRLTAGLGEVLDARAAVVARLARDTTDLVALDAELGQLGIPAVLRGPDGEEVVSDPSTPRLGEELPGGADDARSLRRTVPLGDGGSAEVLVSTGAVDATLQRTLLLETVGALTALLLALVLLRRSSEVITRPLDTMVEVVTHIAEVDRRARLRPTDPGTEIGRLAAAFDRTFDALDAALTEAEAAESRSRRFLADAAHQLRTPLAGLRASAETLLAHPDAPERQQLAGNISREATRMARLVDQLLRIARIDRGEPPLRAATDLVELARSELERQRELAPQLTFALHADEDVPLVSCDATAVREALANLLDNARRHGHGAVQVTLHPRLGGVDLEVRDDGDGVSATLAGTMFDRFSTTSGGAGLGLPIARGIAEAHGGSLTHVDGAFVLRLPIAGLDTHGPAGP